MYLIAIQKKKIILEELYIEKKRNIYMWNQYYYYFNSPKFWFDWAHTTKSYVAFS